VIVEVEVSAVIPDRSKSPGVLLPEFKFRGIDA